MASEYASKSGSHHRYVVGVFELIGPTKDHLKTSRVYVVNDPSLLRLKYILSIEGSLGEYKQVIENKFNTLIACSNKVNASQITNVRNKRLLKEVQYAMSGASIEFGLSYNIPEDNFYKWDVSVGKVDTESALYSDMQQLGINDIKMEITFDQMYPINPPFVRIVEPVFVYRTGNITMGGSICMELLTNQGWSVACSIESLLIQIKANILETGRIDHHRVGQKYSMSEARVAFKRMVISHGWK